MRGYRAVGVVLVLGLGVWGCGGSNGYSNSTSGNPSAPTPSGTPGVITVNVVAINGAQSFAPNPATLPAGTLIVWHFTGRHETTRAFVQ